MRWLEAVVSVRERSTRREVVGMSLGTGGAVVCALVVGAPLLVPFLVAAWILALFLVLRRQA